MSETVVKPLSFIQTVYAVRPINRPYVEELRSRMRTLGVKPYPLSVTPDGVLYGGLHRYEAFTAEGVTECLMHVHQPASLDREAIELNQASADTLPMTFVDYAELVWRKTATQTQQDVAEELGWKQQRVQQFAALQNVTDDAWQIITTTMREDGKQPEEDEVVEKTTVVVFSERLLRAILPLTPSQQLACVRFLAKGRDTKGRPFGKKDFKALADDYRTYNRLGDAAWEYLAVNIPSDAIAPYVNKAEQTLWDRVYLEESTPAVPIGPKARKCLDALIAAYEQEARVRILVKDLADVTTEDIADASIDAIVTDPPYSQDAIPLFEALGALAARVLKPGGSLLVLCGQLYFPTYIEILSRFVEYHWTCAVFLPGGQAVQIFPRQVNAFWKPVLWFTNGPKESIGWNSDVWHTTANNNDKTHHPWGQSEELMTPMVERASLPGETVLDPFLGGGTTGVICRRLGRVFIGIEQDEAIARAAMHRIGEGAPHV